MRIRPARFANSWYPADPAALGELLEKALGAASEEFPIAPCPAAACLLPHSGLRFSAALIMAGLSGIKSVTDLSVLILAPSHYFPLDADQLYTANFAGWETPLGQLAAWNIRPAKPHWETHHQALEMEHALEMFLPALAFLNPQCRVLGVLVPAITSLSALGRLTDLVEAELQAAPGQCLVIASTDLTHYGRRFDHEPFGPHYADCIQAVRQRDRQALECLATADAEAFFAAMGQLAPTMCGRYPALVLSSLAARHRWQGRFSGYYNSVEALAAAEGDWPLPVEQAAIADFVSYGALAYQEAG